MVFGCSGLVPRFREGPARKSEVMRTRAATEGTAVWLRMNRVLGFSVMKFAVGPFSRWEKGQTTTSSVGAALRGRPGSHHQRFAKCGHKSIGCPAPESSPYENLRHDSRFLDNHV